MKKIIIIFLILFLLYFFAPTLFVSFVYYSGKNTCIVDMDCGFDIEENSCINKHNKGGPKRYEKIKEDPNINCKCSNIFDIKFCSKK